MTTPVSGILSRSSAPQSVHQFFNPHALDAEKSLVDMSIPPSLLVGQAAGLAESNFGFREHTEQIFLGYALLSCTFSRGLQYFLGRRSIRWKGSQIEARFPNIESGQGASAFGVVIDVCHLSAD